MTKERIEKELTKVRAQLETLQAKQKDLEEQKRNQEARKAPTNLKQYTCEDAPT